MNRLLARHDQLARLGRPVRLKELERLRLLCCARAADGTATATPRPGAPWR
ncbi:MAG: hypothetical protein ACLRNQ_14595 [Flavonifractor plautii]